MVTVVRTTNTLKRRWTIQQQLRMAISSCVNTEHLLTTLIHSNRSSNCHKSRLGMNPLADALKNKPQRTIPQNFRMSFLEKTKKSSFQVK